MKSYFGVDLQGFLPAWMHFFVKRPEPINDTVNKIIKLEL